MEFWHNDYCMGVKKPEVGRNLLFYKCRAKDVLLKWEHSKVS